MDKITQDKLYKQAVIRYSMKYGVTKAAIHYKTSRQNIYRWRKKYDGTLQSLADCSRRPHHHPNQHAPEEIKLILDMRRRNPNTGLVVFWVKLRQRGYTRSISGLYRFLRKRNQMAVKLPNPKYIPQPYEQMSYPGQRCQIDNGAEFTKGKDSEKLTLFEEELAQLGIRHKRIKPYTPRHNGKVERSHRKDNEEFYACHKFHSFQDFQTQLARRQRQYNNFPMRPLNWRSPKVVLFSFPNV